MEYNKARALLERVVWRHTHRDFRSVREDGTKVINHYVDGSGTCSVPLACLSMQQLYLKLTARERDDLPIEVREFVSS